MVIHQFDVRSPDPRLFAGGRVYLATPDAKHLVSAYNQELAYNLFIEGNGMGLAYIFDGSSHLRRDRDGDNLTLDLPSGQKKIYFKGGAKSNSANAIRNV